jgi:hypothetical protein
MRAGKWGLGSCGNSDMLGSGHCLTHRQGTQIKMSIHKTSSEECFPIESKVKYT